MRSVALALLRPHGRGCVACSLAQGGPKGQRKEARQPGEPQEEGEGEEGCWRRNPAAAAAAATDTAKPSQAKPSPEGLPSLAGGGISGQAGLRNSTWWWLPRQEEDKNPDLANLAGEGGPGPPAQLLQDHHRRGQKAASFLYAFLPSAQQNKLNFQALIRIYKKYLLKNPISYPEDD